MAFYYEPVSDGDGALSENFMAIRTQYSVLPEVHEMFLTPLIPDTSSPLPISRGSR